MIKAFLSAFSAACLFASGLVANAATLQVAPVLVEVPKSGASSRIVLRNLDKEPLNAQIRIFKWTQVNGKDKLLPTRDVVASPPLARLKPGSNATVRIVRVSKSPVVKEESYRLIIDELPKQRRKSGSSVNLVMRYSVPVFFGTSREHSPQLSWRVEQRRGKVVVVAKNTGNRRLRVARLKVAPRSGAPVSFGNGLVGYVLGGSEVRWSTGGQLRGVVRGSQVKITANGDIGPIRTRGTVQTLK